jgi:hypothetical protein
MTDVASLKNSFPATKEKTIFVLVLYDNEVEAYRQVLIKSGAHLAGKAGFTNFYVFELKP